MRKNLVDFDYVAERLYAIIRDADHRDQLEAIKILLTLEQQPQIDGLDQITQQIANQAAVLQVKPSKLK